MRVSSSFGRSLRLSLSLSLSRCSLLLSLSRARWALLVKLLAAMANVHMSILKRLLPPLFLPTHPQLLTRGSCSCNSRRMRRAECMRCFWPSLCVGCAAVDLLLAVLVEVHARGIQHDAVCSMLARFDTKHLRVQRPTTEAATEEAVQQIIAAALASYSASGSITESLLAFRSNRRRRRDWPRTRRHTSHPGRTHSSPPLRSRPRRARRPCTRTRRRRVQWRTAAT